MEKMKEMSKARDYRSDLDLFHQFHGSCIMDMSCDL